MGGTRHGVVFVCSVAGAFPGQWKGEQVAESTKDQGRLPVVTDTTPDLLLEELPADATVVTPHRSVSGLYEVSRAGDSGTLFYNG